MDFVHPINQRFPTDELFAEMREALPASVRRYGSSQRALNEKLAAHLACDPDRVQVLHGASQIFPILQRMAADRPVVRPQPTFGEYARLFPRARTFADQPGIDPAHIERHITDDGMVLIASPNSPSGSVLPTDWILGCAQRHPHTQFVVDESFIEFFDETPLVTRLATEPQPNVLVVRSLSGPMGVPGLRLGYVYSTNADMIHVLEREIPRWNIGGPAEFFLERLPHYREAFAQSLEMTKADRRALAAQLAAVPGVQKVHPSGGNFLLVTLAGAPDLGPQVCARLRSEWDIAVKDVSPLFTPPAPRLRVAVRRPEDHARLCEALGAAIT